jgi:hypothetical protein
MINGKNIDYQVKTSEILKERAFIKKYSSINNETGISKTQEIEEKAKRSAVNLDNDEEEERENG